MANKKGRCALALSVEALETREMLAVDPLNPSHVLAWQSFDHTNLGALPTGWSQGSSTGSFAVSTHHSSDHGAGLASSGMSGQTARTWISASQPADIGVSAAVYVDSLIPAEVLVRGSNLDSANPSYYAVSVTRALHVELVRVVHGKATILGHVTSAEYFSDQWVRAALYASGKTLKVQIYRPDTGQYLNRAGRWQSAPTWALNLTDTAITSGGQVGLGRAGSYSGTISFDDFTVVAPPRGGHKPAVLVHQTFDHSKGGLLPAGWSQWSNIAPFRVSRQNYLSPPSELEASAGRGQSAEAWLNTPEPADVQVSAAVLLDSLAPAQVLARARNLGTTTPTYYALSVVRGLEVQLARVVNGVSTTLGRVFSHDYVSGRWVLVTLNINGADLWAQVYRYDTKEYLNRSGRWQSKPAWALHHTDKKIVGGGEVGLGRPAGHAGSVSFDDFRVAGTSDPQPTVTITSALTIPRHYSHIRIAELAYSGTVFGAFEDQLLRNSVDLVIPNSAYLNEISAVASQTPELIYTNTSSLYLNLLTDWLDYADAHHVSREGAFYHAAQPIRFSGQSSSSQPVNWFWGIYDGGGSANFIDYTAAAHTPLQGVQFGQYGEAMYLGYPDQFREINFNLASGASGGWSAVLEYATAVDSNGNPTAWATLRTITDTTHGLTRSGQIIFDPPAGWQTASINNPARMFYVRIRTVSGGTAPVANTILGRDYVQAHGRSTGVTPVFDWAADKDHDGYLTDAEYAHRRRGEDARFYYESRVFLGSYGQMRPATNPADLAFRNWAVNYSVRYLNSEPQADGLFVDNSGGRAPVLRTDVREEVSSYASDYGTMLHAIGEAIAPRWVMANIGGGGTSADTVVKQNTAYFEEFAIRPLAQNYQQFEDLAATIAHRARLRSPAPYAVLDSLPIGGSPTDSRTQLATLAYYYLLADPKFTFLDFYGGYEPASSWNRHWSPAAAYDIGQPTREWSLFASGHDPSNHLLTYRVYQRSYTHALVLYKPLSYSETTGAEGKLGAQTATTQHLGGAYRVLRADGTLGPAVTSITLRNGEGAILIK